MSTASVSNPGSGTTCGRVEMKIWKASCSSTATAKLVSSIVAALARRTGRNATRSRMIALIIATPMATGAAAAKGNPCRLANTSAYPVRVMRAPCAKLIMPRIENTTASNGLAALESITGGRPALILLDMRMPVMDGWGFASALRARGTQTRVLVMTAAENAKRWADEIGADAVLAKPFELDDLLGALERLRR